MSNEEQKPCPVCRNEASVVDDVHSSTAEGTLEEMQWNCPRCGVFDCHNSFEMIARPRADGCLREAGSRERANLSAWLRGHTDRGGSPAHLDSSFLETDQPNDLRDAFAASGTPRFHEKADRLLLAVERQTEHAGEDISINLNAMDAWEWEARAWALNKDEFSEICEFLASEKKIRGFQAFQDVNLRLRPNGWARIEELASTSADSDQGFVAMWFDDEVKGLYTKALAPAIRAAGYAPLRIDERPTSDRIDDRIEVEIKRSRFVIADATEHRGGVYYEAGFARGLKIPVIWTCRKDHFDDRHFDTSQFHCESWTDDTLDKLAEQLRWRIENICGRGPVKYDGSD